MSYRFFIHILIFWFPTRVCSPCTVIAQLVPLYSQQLGYGVDPNIVYLFGGQTTDDKTVRSIYKWNISSNHYIELSTTTPTSVFFSLSTNMVQINDTIYFVGTPDSKYIDPSGSVYIFDVNTESWIDNTNITPMPHPAIYGCLTGNTTHLFFIGGQSDGSTWLDRLQIYDIYRNIWFDEAIYITPRTWSGWSLGYCQTANGYLYIFGGEVDADFNFINDIFKWNPNQGWSHIGYLPANIGYGMALRHYNFIYIIGGGEGIPMNTIFEFDTNLETITNEYHMVDALHSVASGIINNRLYIFGGWNGNEAIDDVQMCDILNSLVPTQSSILTTSEPILTTSPITLYPSTVPIIYNTEQTTNINSTTSTQRQLTSEHSVSTTTDTSAETATYVVGSLMKTTIQLKEDTNDKDFNNDTFISTLILYGIGSIIGGFLFGGMILYCKLKRRRKAEIISKAIAADLQQKQDVVVIEDNDNDQPTVEGFVNDNEIEIAAKTMIKYSKCRECGALLKENIVAMEGIVVLCMICKSLNRESVDKEVDKMFDSNNKSNDPEYDSNKGQTKYTDAAANM